MKVCLKYCGLFLLIFISLAVLAQPIHQRKDITVESILMKKSPNQFRAMENKEKYLVLEKVKTLERKKIHLEEPIFFTRRDGVYFEGTLTRLTDSTLTLTYYDDTSLRSEVRLFYLNDIERVFKRSKNGKIRWGLHASTFAPVLYDWLWWRESPLENPRTLYGVLALAGANTLIANSDKFFRSKKIGKRNRLRVFQYY